MITQLAIEVFGVLCGLLLLSLCGAWALPVDRSVDQPAVAGDSSKVLGSRLGLAAPLAGLGVLSAMMSALYGLGFELRSLIALSIGGSVSLSLWLGRERVASALSWPCLRSLVIAALVSTLVANVTNLLSGGAAIMLLDATDPFGYAQVADWFLDHSRADLPIADPSLPYQSWIQHCFEGDRRPGSYLLLSAATLFWGGGAIFVYPRLCALLVAAAILALVGLGSDFVIKRRRDTLLLWCGGILAAWTTLAHTGFLAKLIAYPGTLLVIGLVLRNGPTSWRAQRSRRRATGVFVLTLGYSMALFGGAVAMFLGAVWAALGLRKSLLWRYRELLLFAGAAYLTGLWQKPSGVGAPPAEFGVITGLGIMFDLDAHLQPLDPPLVAGLLILVFSALGFLIYVAWRLRDTVTLALLAAPLPVMVAGLATDRIWHLAQCTGFFFPLSVLGAVRLLRGQRDQPSEYTIRAPMGSALLRWTLVAIIVMFAVRLPRFAKSMHRFGAPNRANHRIARRDMDAIAKHIGGALVEIRVPNSWVWALMPMVEFGRRKAPFVCDPGTYSRLVSYRDWDMPETTQSVQFALASAELAVAESPRGESGELVWENSQYRLYRQRSKR